MEVYRYLHQSELNNILNGKTEELGKENDKPGKLRKNTHKYKEGIKYIHFFKSKSSMLMTSYLYHKLDGNFFFCTFDIPITTLIRYGGKGYYPASGYDNLTVLNEYAVPADKFKPEWLKEYTLDINRDNITFSDVSQLSK